jgi:hypothetical protein
LDKTVKLRAETEAKRRTKKITKKAFRFKENPNNIGRSDIYFYCWVKNKEIGAG